MRAAGLKPTVNTYTSLIDACGKCSDLNQAESFLTQMMAEGVPPNACTITTLIQACCRIKEFKRAVGFLGMLVQSERTAGMRSAAAQLKGAIADKTPYTTLIKASLHTDIDTAFEALSLMQDSVVNGMHTLRPEQIMLSEMLDACSTSPMRVDRALEAFRAYQMWEYSPSWHHLHCFLDTCVRDSELDHAHYLLQLVPPFVASRTLGERSHYHSQTKGNLIIAR